MEAAKSKVYVKVDGQSRILRVEGGYSTSNIKDPENWILIDEGTGDRYNLCQSHYFPDGLYTMDRIHRYKLVNGEPVLRTEEEIQADRTTHPQLTPEPTLESRVDALELDSAETREALEMILSGVTE